MMPGSGRPLVLDASAALAIILGETGASRVQALVRSRQRVLVPWLFWFEVTNTLGTRLRWQAARVMEAIYDLEQLGLVTCAPDRPSLLQVIDAVETHALSAYDAAYLVLVEQEDAELLTGDADLAAAAGARAIPVAPPHRLTEAAARYESRIRERLPRRETWPGAAAYLQELRQEVLRGGGVTGRS